MNSEINEREALALALRQHGFYATHADRWNDSEWQARFWSDAARAVVASDWLAAHDAEVRRATGEQIAQAIEDSIGTEPVLMHVVDWVEGVEYAARLAREVTR